MIGARAAPAQRLILTIATVSIVAAIVLALALAFLWSRPIQHITTAARSIARGDLATRIRVSGHDEVGMLARSLNRMQERLSAHVDTIDRQRRTLDSLVSQLREGVVLADGDGRIVLINQEAVRMLQPELDKGGSSPVGMTVEQCVPQLKLQTMLGAHGTAVPARGASRATVRMRRKVRVTRPSRKPGCRSRRRPGVGRCWPGPPTFDFRKTRHAPTPRRGREPGACCF